MWTICRGKPNFFDLGSLMTSQIRSKSKCLTILRVWLCRTPEPHAMEISQCNDMDRVWNTYMYHPKLSMCIFKVKVKVIQGHEIKERSNWKFWAWSASYIFLGQFFVTSAKMTLEHFLTAKIGQILKIGKMRKSPEIAWKVAVPYFQNAKTFSRYLHAILYTYTPDRVLSHIFCFFFRIPEFSSIFSENDIFIDYFLQVSKSWKS